jgi:hypothetical protein
MSYKVGDVVKFIHTDLARVVGTKEEPYYNSAMPFNKEERVKEPYDYVIMFFSEKKADGYHWAGTQQATESQLASSEIDGIKHFSGK